MNWESVYARLVALKKPMEKAMYSIEDEHVFSNINDLVDAIDAVLPLIEKQMEEIDES